MRMSTRKHEDLTGSLLVAMPTLHDPNFRRTILFIARHEAEEGAMGVILNRPEGKRLSDLDDATPEPIGSVPVFEGGPVERHQLILARMTVLESGTRFESLGRDDSALIASGTEGSHSMRAFVGYAGWSAGQLEREIAEKSWLIMPPEPALLETPGSSEEGAAAWRGIMKKLGPWYHLMAGAPDDLSLN